jgi:hypothetical protein
MKHIYLDSRLLILFAAFIVVILCRQADNNDAPSLARREHFTAPVLVFDNGERLPDINNAHA